MIAALFACLIVGQFAPPPGELVVGPVHLGERVADVQKKLGPGWRGQVYDPASGQYLAALVYTDGVDQLELFVEVTSGGEKVASIVARENRAQGAAMHGPELRRWRWRGGTVFAAPASVRGWSAQRWHPHSNGDRTIASYSYGHPLVVWITENSWGGVDFHMFEE